MGRLCVVVPTYNEAKSLSRLVVKIQETLTAQDFNVVVVDDNSLDETARLARKLSRVYGNVIVRQRKEKLGLGSAVVEGLRTSLRMEDVDRIITLDADLSHNPGDIPNLLRAARKADLVQGSRYVENGRIDNWGFRRRLTSRIANLLCMLFLRTAVRDCTSNFRVYSRECAEAIVNCTRRDGFDWVVEAMAIARNCGFRVEEVPITFTDRKYGKTKLKSHEIVNWARFVLRNLFLPVQMAKIGRYH